MMDKRDFTVEKEQIMPFIKKKKNYILDLFFQWKFSFFILPVKICEKEDS